MKGDCKGYDRCLRDSIDCLYERPKGEEEHPSLFYADHDPGYMLAFRGRKSMAKGKDQAAFFVKNAAMNQQNGWDSAGV